MHTVYDEKLIEKAMFRKGNLDGLLFSYDAQGKIREKKEYRWNPETKNSDLHGIYETYNQGKKLIQQTFKNDCITKRVILFSYSFKFCITFIYNNSY